MTLKFTHEEIVNRYKQFVREFLSEEKNVEREELAPNFWIVRVPEKDFKVAIRCECIGDFHSVEQWCAVVTNPDGEKSNFLLFEDEINEWAAEQRRLKGIE